MHLAPNANGLLRRMGFVPEAHGANTCKRLSQWFPDGREMFSVDLERDAGRWQYPWQLGHRVGLHGELKRLATVEGGVGRPAVLRTRARVVDVDVEGGVVVLEGGEAVRSDVVVGADGVHSRVRSRLPGAEHIKTFGSGKSAYRFLIPREKVLAEELTRKFADTEGHLIMVFARDRRVVVYPTSDNTLLNFVCIHPTEESQIQSGEPGSADWQKDGNLSKMLEVYKDFEPAVLKLLGMAEEETLKVWELLDMEALPTWTAGKLVLIGDAAHPFTPRGFSSPRRCEQSCNRTDTLNRSRTGCRPSDRRRRFPSRHAPSRHAHRHHPSTPQTIRKVPLRARLSHTGNLPDRRQGSRFWPPHRQCPLHSVQFLP